MTRNRLLLAAATLALSGCAGGFADAPPIAVGQAAPISPAERQQGSQAHPGLITEYGGAYAGGQSAYVTFVGQRIAAQSGLGANPGAYTITLLNSPANNAFAIPGGYVYVTRQLVALMNDEAELAAVLGHEVAHVATRHSAQRQTVSQRNAILGAIGQVLVGAVAGNTGLGQVLSQGVGTGTQLATLGYSRSQETQSDDLAVQYLVRAGYDPSALASVLATLAAQERLESGSAGDARTTPPWASTHPDPASRVQRAAAQAAATGLAGVRNRDAFLNAINGMVYGDDPAQGVVEGRDFLHPTLRVAFTIPQGFTMQNGAQAVAISGPNTQARFGTGAFNGNLEAYVGNVLSGLGSGAAVPQAAVQRTTVNGVPAAYTQVRAASGQSQVDLTVFAYAPAADRGYHFIILTPAGQGIGAAASMVQSFRTLSAAQAAAIKPRFLRVVTVGAGDSVARLAERMAFPDRRLERFLVLNGLRDGAALTPGQRVKIVTY